MAACNLLSLVPASLSALATGIAAWAAIKSLQNGRILAQIAQRQTEDGWVEVLSKFLEKDDTPGLRLALAVLPEHLEDRRDDLVFRGVARCGKQSVLLRQGCAFRTMYPALAERAEKIVNEVPR